MGVSPLNVLTDEQILSRLRTFGSDINKFIKELNDALLQSLPFINSWPEEHLKTILWHRLFLDLKEHFLFAQILGNESDIDFVKVAEKICKEVVQDFGKECGQYKKKNREDITETIKKAKVCDITSIYKLVKWDKAWIGADFIFSKIITSQYRDEKDDILFFERLSDALHKKSAKSRPKDKVLLKMAKFFLRNQDDPNAINRLFKQLDELGWFNGKKEDLPTKDYEYFKKLLRRHNIYIK